MAVKLRGKRPVDANLFVRDGKEKVFGMFVVFGQVERSPCSHIEQRGVHAKTGNVRRELLIQLNITQALLLADFQPHERAPAGPEIQLAFLPRPVLFVEYVFALEAARGDSGAIDLCTWSRLAWRNDARRVFHPLAGLSKK